MAPDLASSLGRDGVGLAAVPLQKARENRASKNSRGFTVALSCGIGSSF